MNTKLFKEAINECSTFVEMEQVINKFNVGRPRKISISAILPKNRTARQLDSKRFIQTGDFIPNFNETKFLEDALRELDTFNSKFFPEQGVPDRNNPNLFRYGDIKYHISGNSEISDPYLVIEKEGNSVKKEYIARSNSYANDLGYGPLIEFRKDGNILVADRGCSPDNDFTVWSEQYLYSPNKQILDVFEGDFISDNGIFKSDARHIDLILEESYTIKLNTAKKKAIKECLSPSKTLKR